MPWIIISSRKLVYLTDSSLYFFRTNFSFWFKEYRVFPESSSTSFKQAILVTEVGTSTLLYSTFSLITTCISIFECASSACAVSNFYLSSSVSARKVFTSLLRKEKSIFVVIHPFSSAKWFLCDTPGCTVSIDPWYSISSQTHTHQEICNKKKNFIINILRWFHLLK